MTGRAWTEEPTDVAIARSLAGLTPNQELALRSAIRIAGYSRPTFTANDVWDHVNPELVPDNRRALGAVLRELAREGKVRRVEGTVVSERAHGQRVAVWQRA